MSPVDRNKLNRIEDLKNKLFSKNFQTRPKHTDSFAYASKSNIPDSWQMNMKEKLQSGEQKFTKSTFFQKFFLFSIAFFVVALAYAGYIFVVGGNTVSKANIDISVVGNAFVAGGEELPLVIGIANKNSSALDLVDLIVEYPKSATSSGATTIPQIERFRESLGTIPAGSVRNENIKLVLFGEQGTVVPVKISIEYRVEGSNAIFIKDKSYEVSINSTPVNLSVEGPSSISSNQDITLNIKASLNAINPLSGVMLKVDYPVGFEFVGATPSPTLGDNIWVLGDLAPGADRNISVVGKMVDVFQGEEKVFRVWSGTQSKSDKSSMDVIFNSIVHSLNIKQAFIDTKILLNGVTQREHAVDSRTSINGQIVWSNNLDTNVNDLVIRAKIGGNAIDRKTIHAIQGFYDSAKDEIIWDRSSISNFKEINPGDFGSVTFSFSPLSLLSSPGTILSNPSINLQIDISGKQALDGFNVEDLSNSESTSVHIISDVGFVNKALFYSGPFVNSGPVSPKVGQETTYTVVWTVSNSANNISKAQIKSTLPSWIRFVGPVSPASQDLVYNPSSKEVLWNIGNIARGVGITGATREVAFQISFTPSLSQVRSLPVLINDSTLTGHDDFANVDIRVNRPSLRTKLTSDSAFPDGAGLVVE
jgi:hypothetical protein